MAAAKPPTRPPAGASAPVRQPRTDGEVTRSAIIETAGQVFAERGHAGATGKAICERAGVNIAAINYHFGSRDGLYLAVLKEVHARFMSMAFLQELAASTEPAPDKLRRFIGELVTRILADADWPVRVWARELLAPSPLLDRIMREETQPKFERLSSIVAEITGVPVRDARMPQLVLSVIAPCLVLLIVDRSATTPIQPLFGETAQALSERLWRFASAGLERVRADDMARPAARRSGGDANGGTRRGSARRRDRA